jgi:hypothetical protein
VVIGPLTACSRGIVFLPDPSPKSLEPEPEKPVNIHYFFKRNESMGGFVNQNKETSYMKSLHAIYQIGDEIARPKPGSNTFLYEYGAISIDSLPEKPPDITKASYVRRMIRNENPYRNKEENTRYYKYGAQKERVKVEDSGGQPFEAVSKFILNKLYKRDTDAGKNGLYIIISNLLEQGRNTPVFHSFYDQAFRKGLSGALFAINSEFSGPVFRFSLGKTDEQEEAIRSNFNGSATFFIIIVGNRNEVSLYTRELSQNLKWNEVPHNKVVFLIDPEETHVRTIGSKTITSRERYEWIVDPEAPAVPTEKRKYRKYNEKDRYSLINLTESANRKLGLFRWQGDGVNKVEAGVRAYRLDTNLGSRYVAGLQADDLDNECYTYQGKLAVKYSTGIKPKPQTKNTAVFEEIKDLSGLFDYNTFYDVPGEVAKLMGDCPVFFSITTANRELKKGFYQVQYDITPEPVVMPYWIKDRHVGSEPKLLEEMDKEKIVKVENLMPIYQGIIDAYKGTRDREKYTVDFYLVKIR